MLKLYGIPYSPWSEKARFALDYHGVAYHDAGFVPLVTPLWVKLRASAWRRRVTLPVAVDGGRLLLDSMDIARYADTRARGPKLFPSHCLAEIERCHAMSERILSSARALLLERLLTDKEALVELAADVVPAPLATFFSSVSAMESRRLISKYKTRRQTVAEHRALLETELAALSRCLFEEGGARGGLAGEGFTYADLSLAVALHFVVPVADAYIPLGPATRRAFTARELSTPLDGLLAWRDGIYDRYRRGPSDNRPSENKGR